MTKQQQEPPPKVQKQPEAKPDALGGGLFLSHAWDEPEGWSEYFNTQTFAEAKQLQVSTALRQATGRGFPRPEVPPRVWVDCASLPAQVSEADHPLEQVIFGPYQMPVRDLKALVPRAQGVTDGYTMLHLPEGHRFEGTMRIRKFDAAGRPQQDVAEHKVQWEILPGRYHVCGARVLPEDTLSAEAAEAKGEFRPRAEQLRNWCTSLGLRDEVWVEVSLGSLRAECLQLADTMLMLHGGLVAVVTWNYFDRLWPLCEWAVFCARRGPDRVQLAADASCRAALVEHHRAVRRISVDGAQCRDARDRVLLLEMLERVFACDAREVTTAHRKPGPGMFTAAVRERQVDFSRVERYVRSTAIAVFAREAALAASRELGADDEAGWIGLAEELGLAELRGALKKCKPWDWCDDLKKSQAGEEAGPADIQAQYAKTVEAWWVGAVLPVLEVERRRVLR